MNATYHTPSSLSSSHTIGGTPAAGLLPTAESQHDELLDFLLANAGRVPLLSAEEEQRLAERVQAGDEIAKRHFIEANLRLVMHVAKDYQDAGLPLEDLFQEGCIGLIKAIDRYNPDFGKFSTYA